MGNKLDLTGVRSGRLVAIAPTSIRKPPGGVVWQCKCDCGRIAFVRATDIRSGRVESCGCISRENCQKIGRNGKSREIHGGSHTRLYNTWRNMKHRCYYKWHNSYPQYGGRGITVCPEWIHDFKAFQEWAISHGYQDGLTIDRIDNDKGYSPDNCRWATTAEQAINKRPFKRKQHPEHYPKYEICGVFKTSAEWAKETGIKQKTFLDRWEKGDRGLDLIRPTHPRIATRQRKALPRELGGQTEKDL